jgi:arabinofuranosyltransferase
MFNFFVMLWVYCCRRLPVPGTGWMTLASVAAAMIALTRPDGLLFCGMTLIVWLIASDRTLLSKKTLRGAAAIAPLAVVAVHLAWRHSFYGEWVPNTYFAKYTGAWPTAGARYLFSFVMEYCLWTWIIVAVGVVIAQWVSSNARKKQSTVAPVGKSEELIARRVMTAVAVALFLHAGYYTFVIGGDHFEYRVYSHLVPLLWISFFWMIGKANFRPELTIGIVCIAVGLSWPVPWSHFVLSRDRLTREQTLMMRVPVAPSWPVAVRWYARLFDNSQAWLISHFLCVRQEEHSICSSWWMQDMLPSRNEGEKIGGEEFPVMAAGGGIGGLGWVLPHVNFIDCYGLNDYVVARSAVVRSRDRLMAHDRVAPEKYVQAFRPNVALEPGKVTVAVKDHPLTESEIMAIETKWRRFMRK